MPSTAARTDWALANPMRVALRWLLIGFLLSIQPPGSGHADLKSKV